MDKYTIHVITIDDSDADEKFIRLTHYTIQRTLNDYKKLVLSQNTFGVDKFYIISKPTYNRVIDYIGYVNNLIEAEKFTMSAYIRTDSMLHTLNYFCKSACLFDIYNIETGYKIYTCDDIEFII